MTIEGDGATFFERLIRVSISQRWFVLAVAVAVAAAGMVSFTRLPIDAVPDITNVQVQINTAAPGYTPVEVEQRLTFLIETSLSGLPSLLSTRSLSRYGLSQVTAVFRDGTDIYFARQLIAERLQEVRGRLPSAITPSMGPLATGLGEIFMYTVENSVGANPVHPPSDLRTAQDWIVKPQLRTVEGVVEVNSIGGYQKQFHVTPRLDRLLALGLTLPDLTKVLLENNGNAGAGYIERNGEQYLVRIPGQVSGIDEIEGFIVTNREGKPVYLRDVANVVIGEELRTGAATENGREVVLGTVFMLMGENSRAVSRRVAEKMDHINRSLPEGMVAKTVYDRTTLVDKTMQTVRTNLFEGAVLVVAVLFFFLGNLRAAIVTAAVIPLAMLFTMSGMVLGGISANLMSLGALDFGLIVDGSVIVVENCVRRLADHQTRLGRRLTLGERMRTVYESTRQVRQATMFGELIIMVVYLPILALGGVSGKMFHPMAITVLLALGGAMIASLTFIPAAVAIALTGDVRERDWRPLQILQRGYARLVARVVRIPVVVITVAVVICLGAGVVATRLGSEFIPSLDEGDVALHALRIPGTSLSQAIEMQQALEERIRQLPEVSHTFTKIGTAEIATDPMPPSVADGFVIMKPRSEWPDLRKPKSRIVQEIEAAVADIPGNNYEFTQPIQMRFNELIAGVRSDVAVKIFGDDLVELEGQAERVREVLEGVDGAADVKVEQVSGLPMLSVNVDRSKLSRFGLSMSDVQGVVQTAIGGSDAGQIFEGDRRFQIVVRLAEPIRSDPDALGSLPLRLPKGGATPRQRHAAPLHEDDQIPSFIPLASVAEIALVRGPNQISRENGKRRMVVTANVRGRDLGGFVQDAESRLQGAVKLPPGYWRTWGGQFEQLQAARQRLMLVVPAAVICILVLLYISFHALIPAFLVFSGVPFALTGGVLALWMRGIPFSISGAVGFIALSGVAVLNGLVILSFIRELQCSGISLLDATTRGAASRLRPVLMTGLVAALGFLPMAVATGPGAEVQRPLATVIIGGILSSTVLTLIVLPALYAKFGSAVLGGANAHRAAVANDEASRQATLARRDPRP
jgi:heavy metal efflux system protein